MKKVVALVMAFIVAGLAFDVSCFETRADITASAYAETNYLLWTYLNTMFTATAGEQAGDTTTNNTNTNYNLYRDFIEFCGETSENVATVAKINITTAKYGYIKMQDAIDAFVTDGSSALSDEVTEKVTNDFKVIDGGGNPSDNNNNDDDNNYDDDLVYLGSASSSVFMTLVGKYLEDLYNGKRGDVSKEFLCDLIPNYYFDGSYSYDSFADIYLPFEGSLICNSCSSPSDWFCLQKGSYIMAMTDGTNDLCGGNVSDARFCLYKNGVVLSQYTSLAGGGTDKYYEIYYAYRNDNGVFLSSAYHCKICIEHGDSGVKMQSTASNSRYDNIYLSEDACKILGGCPVFENAADAKNYVDMGNYENAINLYDGPQKSDKWYDFYLSEIAKQLEKATKMLTQLPQITTDMLHGFAVGVTGATAGVGANTNPNAQEEAVKKAVEESAGNTAKKYYQKTSKKSKEQIEKEMKVTPSPTKTPTKKVEQTDATMMVDLHEFFPFCVPYDLVHLIKCFCAEPQTPKFDINLKLPYVGTIKTCLDLSMFNEGARILRILETVGFILALVLVSRNLIRG